MILINRYYICYHKGKGAIAQLVEQRTENPCVPGSNPGSTTKAEFPGYPNSAFGFNFCI